VLDVRLPDGSHAQIRYAGDTPPLVSFASPAPVLAGLSPASDLFWPASPFAAPDLLLAGIGAPPLGAQGYSMVSTLSGDGLCTRSIEYRAFGDGRPPQVVTRTSTSCMTEEEQPEPPPRSGLTAVSSSLDLARGQPI